MKIFLSGFEGQDIDKWLEIDPDLQMKYTLMSYYAIRSKSKDKIQKIIDRSELVMIDSGAFSMQRGKVVDWDKYTEEYASWIEENDSDKIVGYFEMDIDNIIGYENVLKLRERLEQSSDKIIPVWHMMRGIDNFHKMCEEYSGKVVSFSALADKLSIENMLYMTQYAWSKGAKIHALGMTAKRGIDNIPFDYVDSSSWIHETVYGKCGDRLLRKTSGLDSVKAKMASYEVWRKKQELYFEKWKGVSPLGDD